MYNSTLEIAYTHLTRKQISEAREVLAKRNERTMANGFEAHCCDPGFRSFYHPGSPTGKQIYRSYTNEELLDFLITYMQHHGHSPDWEKIHHIYKLYLSYRFGDQAKAKAKARVRQKQLTQQAKWPPDWPEHVSSEPYYKWIEERGKTYTEEDKAVIEGICAQARESGMPPELSSEPCMYLGKFGDVKKGLALMNIPPLNKAELRFMARYWKENRTK